MKRHLRKELPQVGLMRELNQAVREELGDVHYATMVAVGWHSRRGLLVMTNAGHPPPLWYRALRQEWRWLETRRASERGRLAGVPLGLLERHRVRPARLSSCNVAILLCCTTMEPPKLLRRRGMDWVKTD